MALPEWSAAFEGSLATVRSLPLLDDVSAWALAGSTGRGVKVAVVDSGVDATHPDVGGVAGAVAMQVGEDGEVEQVAGPHDDLYGHGTACASIIRGLAPDVELYSVRVLGANLKGRGSLFRAGIEWAVDHGMDVVNLSLSSRSETWYGPLHDTADHAYFARTLLVCAANNVPGPTYPSQFASVIGVAALPGSSAAGIAYNPEPPVEFAAPGVDVEVAWADGARIVATGNSFAAPYVAGTVARVLGNHPHLTAFQVKAVLQALAINAGEAP